MGSPVGCGCRFRLFIGRRSPRLEGGNPVLALGVALLVLLPAVLPGLGVGPARALPTLSQVEVRPDPFSPNGDGFEDATEVGFVPLDEGDSLTVGVSVYRVENGADYGILLAPTEVAVGETVRVPWAPVSTPPDGVYGFRLEIAGDTGTLVDTTYVTADTGAPAVTLVSIAPNPFDPAAEPLTIRYTIATTDSTTVGGVVVRQNGVVRKDLESVEGPGTFAVEWDGTVQADSAGASGAYEILAWATDLAGNADSTARIVTVDRDSPTLHLDADIVETIAFPVVLTGYALDEDRLVHVTASFDTGQTFVAVDSTAGSAAGDSLAWWVTVTDPAPVPGWRDVRIRATDAAGHTATQIVDVAYDLFFPEPVSSVLVSGDSAYAPGDTLEIVTTWNAADLHVTANFFALDSWYTVGADSVANEGGGAYRILYGISARNTRAPLTYPVEIRALTAGEYLSGVDTVYVALGGQVASGRLVEIDCNRFDPLAGEQVTIRVADRVSQVTVEIYNLAGTCVAELSGAGVVLWDGNSANGDPVASGVYFLRVESGGSEEARKVAVVRGGRR